MTKTICFIAFVLFLFGCRPDLDYKISGYSQKIIVEGLIVNGEYPIVYLSLNVPLSQKLDSDSIQKYIICRAKVTVSDNVNPLDISAKTEILTAGWNNEKFPPHRYFGTDFKGEEGRTYYLTVDYGGYSLHAKTTIPITTKIVDFKTTAINDSMRVLSIILDIDSKLKNSYRVYTKKQVDGFYQLTPILFNSNLSLSGKNEFNISPLPNQNDSSYSQGSYFKKGDEIELKLCTIDSVSTQFFKELTLFSTTSGIGNDMFIGEKDALKSNISLPGFGIWYGSGTTYYTYIIP